jgi:hypothetical protein
VIFAAPEGDALIMLGETIMDAPHPAGADGNIRSEWREIVLGEPDGITVVVILNATPAQWATRLKAFEAVIGSLRCPAEVSC